MILKRLGNSINMEPTANTDEDMQWDSGMVVQIAKNGSLFVTPSTAVLPFSIGTNDPLDASGQAPRALSWTPFSYPFNLTGQPAITIPCGWSQNGLPAGIQIIGRRFDDLGVLQVARAFEKILPWSSHRPTLVKAG